MFTTRRQLVPVVVSPLKNDECRRISMQNGEGGVWRMENAFRACSRRRRCGQTTDRIHYDLHTFRVFHPTNFTVLTLCLFVPRSLISLDHLEQRRIVAPPLRTQTNRSPASKCERRACLNEGKSVCIVRSGTKLEFHDFLSHSLPS